MTFLITNAIPYSAAGVKLRPMVRFSRKRGIKWGKTGIYGVFWPDGGKGWVHCGKGWVDGGDHASGDGAG
jgi:hypothetical protein